MTPSLLRACASAVVLTCALPCQADSSVTVYGVLDSGLEVSRSGNGTVKREVSGGAMGSRFGLRGAEDLGGGLSAVFRLEQGLNLDDGTLGQGARGWGREASVGLSSKALGTVQLGRLPTPYYAMSSYIDAFNWMGAGGLPALTRSGAAVRQVLPNLINAREDNAVGYVSPSLGGAELRAMVAAGEGSTSIGRAYGLSGRYLGGPVDVVAAYTRQDGAGDGSGSVSSFLAGGSFDFGMAKLFAGISDERNSCTTCTGALARSSGVAGTNASAFRVYNVGARVPFGAMTAIVQLARVDDRSVYAVDPGSRDATWATIGAEYAFSKRTLIYSALGTIGNKNGSQYALGSGTAQQPAGVVAAGNPRATTATIGIRHAF